MVHQFVVVHAVVVPGVVPHAVDPFLGTHTHFPDPLPAVVHPFVVDHAVVVPAVVQLPALPHDPGLGTKEFVHGGRFKNFAVALHRSIRPAPIHPAGPPTDTAVSFNNCTACHQVAQIERRKLTAPAPAGDAIDVQLFVQYFPPMHVLTIADHGAVKSTAAP